MEAGLEGLGRRSALALAGAGVSGVATISSVLIASRSLPRVEAGEFFVAISLFAIVQGICSFGAETGFQYFIPTMSTPDARRLVRIVASASIVLGLAAAMVVWMLAGPLGELLGEGEASSGTADVIRTIAVLLPFAGLYELAMGALRASDRVLLSVGVDRIIQPVLQIALMLAVALTDGGSSTLVLAWAAPFAVAAIVASVLLVVLPPMSNPDQAIEVPQRVFWRYTAPRSIARIAQTMTQRLDVLILAAVYPLEEVAVYGTVSRCMIAGVFVATALRQTVQPRLRRLIVAGDRVGVKNMYGVSTTWLVLVTWPIYLTMIAFAPLVMSIFGPEYVRGAPALVLLCSAMLVASACGLVDVVLLMLGRSWLSSINVVIALALNIALNLLLAPRYGMIGSAIAWVVAILASNLLPLAQTYRFGGLHPGGTPLLTATLGTAMAVAVPTLTARVVFGPELTSFVVAAVIAAVLYAGLLRRRWVALKLDQLIGDLRGRSVTRAQA